MSALTKVQRATLWAMFDGRCAYCGCVLTERWHADHVEPVWREWWKPNGKMLRPDLDCVENLFPACAPCNIDKHASTIEQWRHKLTGAIAVLNRNNPTYRHAVRFGLVQETPHLVVFWFERARAEMAA